MTDDALPTDADLLAGVFEERAEHLSWTELEAWTALTPRDETNITKLMGPGAKLLIGPRGSGKSTLLRTAYFRHIAAKECLPVYVNYAKSLALEPIFHRNANAVALFRQWLVSKIVVGIDAAITALGLERPADLIWMAQTAKLLIKQLATGTAPQEMPVALAPSELVEKIDDWLEALELKRCVLLLDDAAHAFSPEQQREFFEVFRELRSRRVSPKAAVYPGITSYSPYFHVGHEAETLEAWYQPEDAAFIPTMRALVEKRLPPDVRALFADKVELIDFMAYASFGLPRGFLNMISEVVSMNDSGTKPTRQQAEFAVAEHAGSVRSVFRALASKLPRYRNFVDIGGELETALVKTLTTYNRLHTESSKKTTVVAIEEPIDAPLDRMLNMLEYAGVVRRGQSVSRGEKGTFQRYSVHTAIVVTENSLSLGKSYQLRVLLDALTERVSSAFARTKGTALLGDKYAARCTLALPACAKCGTTRQAEAQRFCMKCGSQLPDVSIYEELLRAPIERLPLTPNKLEKILAFTKIRSVHDLLLDDERQHLRQVPSIGPVWAKRILTIAEEFVSV